MSVRFERVFTSSRWTGGFRIAAKFDWNRFAFGVVVAKPVVS